MIRNNSNKIILLVFISLLSFLLCSGCTNNKKVVDVNTDKVINQKANNKNTNEDNPKIEDVTDNQPSKPNVIKQEYTKPNYNFYYADLLADFNKQNDTQTHFLILNNALLGLYKNGKYTNLTESEINNKLFENTKFTIFQNNNMYTNASITYDRAISNDIIYINMIANNTNFDLSQPYFAISNYNIERQVSVNKDNYNYNIEEYTTIIKQLLIKNSFINVPAIIKKLIPIDINNDATDEYIVQATNFYDSFDEMMKKYNYNPYINSISPFSAVPDLKNVCAYDITILVKENNVFILDERYQQLYDFQFKNLSEKEINNLINSNNDLGSLQPQNNVFVLYDNDHQIIAVESTYLPYYENGMVSYLNTIFPSSNIIATLDIDNDGTNELIFKKHEDILMNSTSQILKYTNEKLSTVLQNEIIE
ncbi:hypothetical protein [Vallitalea sp.]|jgi:uncharacterized protein YcfL|uniref:hypothetical protein n=1 Tax=Vallitalea sp. TaxID=1882829 RepID=UPI0025CDCFCA|nr:hypothetical protein [Vallitalea sp.]MCT4686715.1 hypothetical protein [Vallitalea sp.]